MGDHGPPNHTEDQVEGGGRRTSQWHKKERIKRINNKFEMKSTAAAERGVAREWMIVGPNERRC